MADCCAELRSELAALRAEVARLGKVDEESIITKAVKKAQELLKPEIAGVAVVAAGAVKQSGIAKDLAGLASDTAHKSLSKSRSAALSADYAKRIANGALDLGERASLKAGNAARAAAAAGKVAQAAQGTAATANAAANAATLSAKVAQGTASAASTAAAAANTFAASAFGKAILAIANVAALAGSIAGLFALYATLKIVFPRLDAHDYQLQMIESRLSKFSSDMFSLTMRIRKVEALAYQAGQDANRALDEIFVANQRINKLNYQVNEVTGRVNRIEPKVDDAISKAKDALKAASLAQGKADIATQKANEAIAKATIAIKEAELAQGKANTATQKANEAIAKATIAIKEAELAQGKANTATQKANEAIAKVIVLTPKVEEAQETADYAFSTAITIKPIALDALQEAKEIRPISEQALADAFLSLNKVKAVEPIANNAFTATQLQGKQLQGTQLTVGKLGTVTRNHGNQIELNTKEINNLKTADKKIEQKIPAPPPPIKQPNTTNPDQMNEKQFKDLQNQLNIAMAGIVGITALLKPVAENTTPAAIGNAVAPAVCRTTQPGGCMSNLVNNTVNNGNNNLANRLSGPANATANAAQLLMLQNIQSGVNAANTKLGPLLRGANGISGFLTRMSSSLGIDRALNLIAIASNLHNAMMLSANLKITLLEVLSSVGNATGFLQTSEGENVDLNQVFNQGIEAFMTTLIGVDNYAGLKVNLRKYNAIYRAATNSLNAVSSMFNSIGEAIETSAEYTGKIGNALRAASVVRENAYNFMSEKISVKTSRFMTFENKIGGVTQALETINEIAENVVEGQQQYTEAVKATNDFKTALANAERPKSIDNKLIKEEAEKIKANLVKDPTGEDETGLLSFLTD